MALNHVSLCGRLTADPTMRYTNNQKPVVSFTLAVDRDFGEGADFINIVAWDKTASFVEKYFSKGKMAIVAGRLQMRQYEDKEGHKRTVAEVVATNVYFAESKKNEQVSEIPYNKQKNEPTYGNASDLIDRYPGVAKRSRFTEMDDDGDLPF